MKETILYISKSEQDIRSFLKYLQSKLEAEHKECTLDEKYDILKVIGTLQSSYFVGAIPLEAETKISYCPMCGRKLVEE